MTSIVVAPSPMKKPHLKPRCAPSLRMVRLIGPGRQENAPAQAKPASAASRMGWDAAMSVSRLRFVLVLFNFLAPGAGNMRTNEAVKQIAGEEQRQDVIQNFLAQNQQATDEQRRNDHLQKCRGRAQAERLEAGIFHFAHHHGRQKNQDDRQQIAPMAEIFFLLVQLDDEQRQRGDEAGGGGNREAEKILADRKS